MLWRIVYVSRPVGRPDSQVIGRLVQQSRLRNRLCGITGVLICYDDRFMQALEGQECAVRSLMDRLFADPRHKDVEVLIDEPAPRRQFEGWALAYGSYNTALADEVDFWLEPELVLPGDTSINAPLLELILARLSSQQRRLAA